MTQQPDLFAIRKAPRVGEQDVACILLELDGKGWRTARQFRMISDRELRAIAAASHGQIISGQKGYARTDQASVEDVNHAAAWLESQAKSMQVRAGEIRKAMHRRDRGAPRCH